MVNLVGVLLFTFATTFVLAVPFINLLYKLKFQRQREQEQKDIFGRVTSIVNRLHGWKVGTPNAGGILIIVVTIVLSAIFYKSVPGYDIVTQKYGVNWVAFTLYSTLISFGALGLYDDVRKFYGFSLSGGWGLRIRYKFLLQILLALGISWLLYNQLELSSVYVPILALDVDLGTFYVLYATFVIVATANAVNITDGLDGLVSGLMIMVLAALWYLASTIGLTIASLDVVLFIAVIIGSLLAFLYFNIYPARVWLGDTGALALGAMLAVISLLTNTSLILPFIGLVFVTDTASVLIQWSSKALRGGKKVFLTSPLHHHFEARGWDETKVTMRFWLAGAVSAFVGIFVALFGR
ncbi:MAG TPA: phospho-N-acetylmuramoyl-pentapeptide-transferase [Candidatus Nanoarchaeia archaeon]|nr:phospho-N-acetylmuramoyl-pentapeptide-transferase [uncultured archaeon]